MSIDNFLVSKTDYLFNCDHLSDNFDPEGNSEHLDCVKLLLEKYSWNEIFKVWNNYLHNNCKTPEEVINFCNLFCYYGGSDHKIRNAYKFIGYLYYMVDIDKYWEEAGDLIDGLAISILEKAGKISMMKNPYYQSWNDPKIIAEVEKYRNGK